MALPEQTRVPHLSDGGSIGKVVPEEPCEVALHAGVWILDPRFQAPQHI